MGQRADDPQTELANSHPPGLATTMRMAARPSRCLQRMPLHPSISQLRSVYAVEAKRSNYRSSTLLAGSACRRSRRAFRWRQSCYSPPHVPVIDVHSFGFTYPGAQRPAVRDVAFSVAPGEIFGIAWPSGAGKSTTQNALIRLLDGYEGSVAVLGKDLRAWDRGC